MPEGPPRHFADGLRERGRGGWVQASLAGSRMAARPVFIGTRVPEKRVRCFCACLFIVGAKAEPEFARQQARRILRPAQGALSLEPCPGPGSLAKLCWPSVCPQPHRCLHGPSPSPSLALPLRRWLELGARFWEMLGRVQARQLHARSWHPWTPTPHAEQKRGAFSGTVIFA